MLEHNFYALMQSKKILLLQGPIGFFFTTLSKYLSQSSTVFKFNFNAGDRYFYPSTLPNTFDYNDTKQNFSYFLTNFINQYQINAIVCFGDTRPYHRIARKFCMDNPHVKFWVFEEGYFRPDYITLEKDGVNDFSTLPRNAEFFLKITENLPEPRAPQKVAQGFWPIAKLATQYYISAYLGRKDYPNYEHHRRLDLPYYIKLWATSGIKRAYYHLHDYCFAKRVEKGKLEEFFIVPLQVYDDSQVKYHCDFDNIEHFLMTVIKSFIANAPSHTNLIIKHHPMDRGFVDYSKIIKKYKKNYPNITQRIFYIHDVPMPVLLRKAKGMVTINSTSGISALLHKIPTITLGRANYHFAGLTYQNDLDSFWQNAKPPNEAVFDAYRKFHLHTTHMNGSYYTRVIWK